MRELKARNYTGRVRRGPARQIGCSGRLPVLDRELQRLRAVAFVDCEPVDRAMRVGQRRRRAQKHGFERRRPSRARLQLEMALADDALVARPSNSSSKRGAGKPWPQTCRSSIARGVERAVLRGKRAVGFDDALEVGRRQQLAHGLFECRAKALESAFAQRQAGGGGVAAEAQDQSGMRAWRRDRAHRAGAAPRIERPEPLISPSLPRAKAMTGRWKRSFRREATMPITP